jgi:hypothetical protein
MIDNPVSTTFTSLLRAVLETILNHEPVDLAYLYGSVVTGQTTPFSDVDIALVASKPLQPLERLKLILHVQSQISDQAGIANLDVRIVNDAPLVFRGRVVRDGILVYVRNDQVRVDFETTTRLQYFDYLPIHKQLQSAFFTDIRERGLYG